MQQLVNDRIEKLGRREPIANPNRSPRVIGRVTRGIDFLAIDNHFGLPIDGQCHATDLHPGNAGWAWHSGRSCAMFCSRSRQRLDCSLACIHSLGDFGYGCLSTVLATVATLDDAGTVEDNLDGGRTVARSESSSTAEHIVRSGCTGRLDRDQLR